VRAHTHTSSSSLSLLLYAIPVPLRKDGRDSKKTYTRCAHYHQCNAGYTGPDGGKTEAGLSTCSPCQPGTYKTVVGSPACSVCVPHAHSILAATSCFCNAGYTGDADEAGTRCSPCAGGTYKGVTGSAVCLVCAEGYYSEEAAASVRCLRCANNSFSPAASSDASQCLCNVGYTGPDGGPCEACEAGKYKNVTGSDTCAHCPGCCFLHSCRVLRHVLCTHLF
jgi:hypothetical protein